MALSEYCNRNVVITTRDTEIREVARLMRENHVGDVLVTERQGEANVPVGIVTDRDLVVEVLAADIELTNVTVGDVMSTELATARETDGLWDTLDRMRRLGVRRMPVVNEDGGLEGILAADDVLDLLSEALTDLSRLARMEIAREVRDRP